MANRSSRLVRIAAVACAIAIAAAGAGAVAAKKDDGKAATESRARKVLVVMVATDPSTRSSVEDVVAGEISLRGTAATASHVLFPELPKERGPFEQKVAAEGFDAVVVGRLVARDDKSTYKEGTESYQAHYLGQDFWGGYWYTYSEVYLPEYLSKETRVRVRADFWRGTGQGGKLVWSGTTDVFDPMTLSQAAREIGVSIAKALSKAKLI